MSIFFRKKRISPVSKKALLFNAGSILDYVALYFLISTAVDKGVNHQVPTLNEYGFIAITLLSWLLDCHMNGNYDGPDMKESSTFLR